MRPNCDPTEEYCFGEGFLDFGDGSFDATLLTGDIPFAIDNVFAVVPEPSSLVLLGVALTGLSRHRAARRSGN